MPDRGSPGDSPSPLRHAGQALALTVRVAPRASKNAVAGVRHAALLVRLTAPPIDGAANAALILLIAKTCRLPARAVTLVSGERGRVKVLHLEGITAEDAAACLGLGPERAT